MGFREQHALCGWDLMAWIRVLRDVLLSRSAVAFLQAEGRTDFEETTEQLQAHLQVRANITCCMHTSGQSATTRGLTYTHVRG